MFNCETILNRMNFMIETEVQIEPFSTEEDIKHKVIAVVANCYDPLCQYIVCLNWKASMKKKRIMSESEKIIMAMWAKKIMEDFKKPLIFKELTKKQ